MTNRPTRAGRWLHAHLGRRGECLVFFGSLDLVYAWSMFTADSRLIQSNATFHWVSGIAPMSAWAVLWTVVGAICLYHAFQQYDRFGFIAAVGIKVVWGLISLGGCATDNVSVGSVGIWLGLAGLVWRISGWREPEPGSDDET